MTDSPRDTDKDIDRAIESSLNVILEGQSGVGKDYFARLIHQRRNWGGEFIVYDCEQTVRDQTGIVEKLTSPVFFQRLQRPREKDTVFIRRVDLLQAHLLARLADFLDELVKRRAFPRNEVLSLGIIGSLQTSGRKESLNHVQLHRFLNSLFCLKIKILPLIERKKEIPKLVESFIALFNKEQKRKISGMAPDALGLILQYNWPDNVCELRMEVERAVTLTRDYEPIKPSALSEHLIQSVSKMC